MINGRLPVLSRPYPTMASIVAYIGHTTSVALWAESQPAWKIAPS